MKFIAIFLVTVLLALPTLRAEPTTSEAEHQLIADEQKLPTYQVKADPDAADFPGVVAADVPRVSKTIQVDPKVPGWHSTGLWANAGEIFTVEMPTDAVKLKVRVQTGSQTDHLWKLKDPKRAPQIVRAWSTTQPSEKHASAFGGLVYILVPPGTSGEPFDVTIGNVIESPLFVLGKTDVQEWINKIRSLPGPWAEIGSDKIFLTVPSKVVRNLDNPDEVMKFWNRVADADADLATIPHERARPERYVADKEISAGYMHSGYPIETHLDAAKEMVDLPKLQAEGNWGLFHELGHNHQNGDWTFAGSVEVTVNLFTMYDIETLCPNAPTRPNMTEAAMKKRRDKYFADGAKFDDWKSDPFLALVFYYDLKQAFGWDSFKKVFAEYRALPKNERPKNDDEKRDQWLVRYSKTVGKNLDPFFQMWGVPTSDAARKSIENLPAWSPPYATVAK